MQGWKRIPGVPCRVFWHWDGSDDCTSITLESEDGVVLGWVSYWEDDPEKPEDKWRVNGWRLGGAAQDSYFETFQEAADFLEANVEWDLIPPHVHEVRKFFRMGRGKPE